MKNSLLSFLAALALAAVLAAGCGGSSTLTAASSATPTPVPTPSVACTPPVGIGVSLVYPPPGPSPSASFLPYAQGIMIAASPVPLPTNWYVYVTNNLTASPIPIAGGTLIAPPSPFPTPFSDPGNPNETLQYSPIGIFATNPGATWNTYIANTNCFPGVPIPNGTFNS
jgi:hypothetical protein